MPRSEERFTGESKWFGGWGDEPTGRQQASRERARTEADFHVDSILVNAQGILVQGTLGDTMPVAFNMPVNEHPQLATMRSDFERKVAAFVMGELRDFVGAGATQDKRWPGAQDPVSYAVKPVKETFEQWWLRNRDARLGESARRLIRKAYEAGQTFKEAVPDASSER